MRDYDFRGSLVLDTYYNTDKLGYYQALQAQGKNYRARSMADLTPWINYFADGFLSSAKVLAVEVALLAKIVGNLPLRQSMKPKISQQEADLLSYVQQFGSVTLSEAEEILPGVPRRTVQRRLKNLADAGYIIAQGTSSGRMYLKP